MSDVIADRVRDLRRREGMGREEVAAAARAAGAPATFTAVALGNIETGRRDADGRRRREVSVDELVFLSSALGRSPLDLLGAHAELFGAAQVECSRCAGKRGDLERVVRADVAELADLSGIEASLAATAYTLAAAVDAGAEGGKQLPALTKELRATLEAIAAGRRGHEEPDDEDEFADLDDAELEPGLDGPE